MIKINIITTCLRTGLAFSDDLSFYNELEASDGMFDILESLEEGLYKKFLNSQRRVSRGTSEGIKIFYRPEPGTRFYLWISIAEDRFIGLTKKPSTDDKAKPTIDTAIIDGLYDVLATIDEEDSDEE